MTDWGTCKQPPSSVWGDCADLTADWPTCQEPHGTSWPSCQAAPDTDWPTCQGPPDTNWPEPPIVYPPPDPGNPINPPLATQYTVFEVLDPVPQVRVSQIMLSEVLATLDPQPRVSQFVVSEVLSTP